MIETLVEELDRGGNILMLEGVKPGVRETLQTTGAEDIIGSDRIFGVEPVLGGALDKALDEADAWLATADTRAAMPRSPPRVSRTDRLPRWSVRAERP